MADWSVQSVPGMHTYIDMQTKKQYINHFHIQPYQCICEVGVDVGV